MVNKGTFDLSVSFLVILIVAIVVMSVLLYFVSKGMHSSQEQLDKAYSPGAEIVKYYASPENPILFQENIVRIKRQASTNAFVSVYNNGFDSESPITLQLTGCMGENDELERGIYLSAIGQEIAQGSAAGYRILLSSSDKVLKGNYICTIIAGYSDSNGLVDTNDKTNSAQLTIIVE
jgi:uncharacterized protein (UPF0333 family)